MKKFNSCNWNEKSVKKDSSNNQMDGWSISLPSFSMPKISIPKITIPNISLPKIELPNISFPSLELPRITVNTDKPLHTLANAVGDVTTIVNPLNQIKNIAALTPITQSLYSETDKLTGGTISSLTRVSNIPARVAKGDNITPMELMEAVVVTMQVAAIVASGGSSAALMAATTSALKKGPLGKTPLGNNIITIIGMTAGGMPIEDIIKEQITSKVKTEAVKQIEQKTGLPISVVAAVLIPRNENSNLEEHIKDLGSRVSEDQLKKAGLSGPLAQAILSANAEDLGVLIKNAPDIIMTAAKREVNAELVKLKALTDFDTLRAMAYEKSQAAIADATDMERIKKMLEAEKDSIIKKELEKQLAKLAADMLKKLNDALGLTSKANLSAAQGSVLVAAAQEGRYIQPKKSDYGPMIAIGLAGAGALGYLLLED